MGAVRVRRGAAADEVGVVVAAVGALPRLRLRDQPRHGGRRVGGARGSSERMQAVRLNPVVAAAAAAVSASTKVAPRQHPSPLRGGDHDAAGNSSALCLARMSLPLPGPPLAGAPFPQDAYFEITIIYLNTRRPEWSASRASRRGRDGSSESDRAKLISFAPDAKNAVQETRAATKVDDHHDKQRHTIMSLGLATAAPPRPSLAGTYASSIGFHSNGAVYLDGNNHSRYESRFDRGKS